MHLDLRTRNIRGVNNVVVFWTEGRVIKMGILYQVHFAYDVVLNLMTIKIQLDIRILFVDQVL